MRPCCFRLQSKISRPPIDSPNKNILASAGNEAEILSRHTFKSSCVIHNQESYIPAHSKPWLGAPVAISIQQEVL